MKAKILLIFAIAAVLCLAAMLFRKPVSVSRDSEQRPTTKSPVPKTVRQPQIAPGSKTENGFALSTYEKADDTSPEQIRKITGMIAGTSFDERLKLVNSLSRKLTEGERRNLYHFLKYGENNTDNHVLKNDIINVLRDQSPPPEELTGVLLDIFYDKNQDIVMRSYALQHLRPWYSDENMKDESVKKAFYDGVKEYDTEISGVALLALSYLSERDSDFDPAFVRNEAVQLAGNGSASNLSRISAAGVCGRMKITEALPVMRQLASSGGSVMLKTAAIAAIGDAGDASDIPLLNQLSRGSPPFSTAADNAARKIRQRF